MTIRTAVGEELLDAGCGIQDMPCMALQAEKRHCRIKEVVIDRAVGRVTVSAVLRDIGMFVDERPLLLHVAPGTGLLGGRAPEKVILHRAVRVVTIVAGHFLFHDRMMGKKAVFLFHFRVTPVTEFRHLIPAYLLLRSLVKLMAIKTTYII